MRSKVFFDWWLGKSCLVVEFMMIDVAKISKNKKILLHFKNQNSTQYVLWGSKSMRGNRVFGNGEE